MSTNVALASNGTTATASIVTAGSAAATIDGVRHTNNSWPTTGLDTGAIPANVVFDFGTSRTITEVDIFTIADAVNYNTNPTLSDTFSLYGITDYTVEYWNGSAWVNFITVSGNNKVWRQHTFSAITTTKLRMIATDGADHTNMRLVEFEAWSSSGSLTITTSSPLTPLTVGDSFSGTFAATDGSGPYTWDQPSGRPTGMSISSGGVTSGTATAAGTFTWTETVTDSLAATATKSFTLVVSPAPPPSPYDELDLTGMEISDVMLSVQRLRADFGQGYGASASVDAGSGLWGWVIESDALPDAEQYANFIDGVPRYQYYLQFFLDHTVGASSEVFMIDFRGKKFHASFDTDDISGPMHTYDLFGLSGVKLKMRRISGVTYDVDGSITGLLTGDEEALTGDGALLTGS